MKKIPLTQGKYALVDDEDFEYLSQWRWYWLNGYATKASARIGGKQKRIYMHRIILKAKEKDMCDHKNANRCDNRKENLRLCNALQNSWNTKIAKNNTSGYKGVFWRKERDKWKVCLTANKQNIYIGSFVDKKEAAKAYNKAAIKYFGEFALLNVV